MAPLETPQNPTQTAPIDAATTPTPAAAPAEQPTPVADTASAAPTATPQDTSAAPTTPTASATPATPAKGIPANALPAGRENGVHGILAHITLGAMAGLAEGVAKKAGIGLEKTGQAVQGKLSNLAYNSPRSQEIRAQALDAQQKKQQMQLEEQKAIDAHTMAQLQQHYYSMQTIKDGLDIQKEESELNTAALNQSADLYSMIQAAAGNDAIVSEPKQIPHHGDMVKGGGGVVPAGATVAPMLGGSDGKAIGDGSAIPVLTGDSGAPIALVNTDWAKKTMTSKDFTIVTKWGIDKDGKAFAEQTQTVPKGSTSYFDLAAQERASLAQKNSARTDFTAQEAAREASEKAGLTGAQTEEAKAAAYKDIEEGKAAGIMAGVGNMNLTGDAYIASLPPAMQDLVHGMLNYQADPQSIGRGKEREALVAATIHADPHKDTPQQWTLANYQERYGFMKEWGSTTKGAGATRDRINTAVGHLDYLAQASDALAQNNITLLNKIANSYGVQTGKSGKIVYDAIAMKAASEAAAAMKGGGAAPTDAEIESQFKQFNSSLAHNVQLDHIRAQYGLLQTQVNTLDGHFQETMKSTPEAAGQSTLYPQNQQIMQKWMSGGGGTANQVPVGKYPVRVHGQIAGYADDPKGTNYHAF